MISFSCRCGHGFSVNDDLAGGLIQCPACKRLNDVPRLGDRDSLDNEGIYKLDQAPRVQNDEARVSELTTIYTREHFDAEGRPIDLRGSFDGPRGPIPVESLGPLDSAPPKYDPLTGELIRDIDIKPELKPATEGLPVARRVLPQQTHVEGIEIPLPREAWMLPGRLLRPVNLLVMLVILTAHLIAGFMAGAIALNFLLLAPFWPVLCMLIIAHYGNVIDETGPSSKTDLPTPLRNLDWHDDTFGSFWRVAVAVTACYAPGGLLLMNIAEVPPQILLPLAIAMLAVGTLLFPAALLTTTTSGSLLNLRPDRLFAVAYISGVEYMMILTTWCIAALTWGIGCVGLNWLMMELFQPAYDPPDWLTWPLAGGLLAAGTWLMHLFCTHLGLLYRRHHATFPWLFQRYQRTGIKNRSKGFPVGRPPGKPAAKQTQSRKY